MQVQVVRPNGEPSACFKCGVKGDWIQVEGFMGKKTWFTTLSDGLCERCFKAFDENRKKLQKQQREQREIASRAKYLGGSLPATDFTFEKADPKINLAIRQVFEAFNPEKENIFVFGRTGTSKTFYSTCVARHALDSGKRVAVYNVRKLNWELQEAAVQGGLIALVDRLAALDVLVLDDLGVSRTSEFRVDMIMEILEARYNAMKPGLIVTSNVDLDGIAEIFSDRVASRLRGMCKPPHGQVIESIGEDVRLRVVR